MFKKLLVVSALLAITTSVSAFEEIECSTEAVFGANSCDQCFTGGEKAQGDKTGLLKDDWINPTSMDKVLYKFEQEMPTMMNLDSKNTVWSQNPQSNEDFWGYTEEFDALYDEDQEGYVLKAGKTVTWIESKLSSVYTLDQNTAAQGANIGLLVYPIVTRNIGTDGDIEAEQKHNECVLFKSAGAAEEPVVVTEEPKRLPETGPAEYVLLMLMAMILAFGVLKISRKNS